MCYFVVKTKRSSNIVGLYYKNIFTLWSTTASKKLRMKVIQEKLHKRSKTEKVY